VDSKLLVVLVGALVGACSRSRSAVPRDAGTLGKLGTTSNLIVNGNAESAAGSNNGDVVASVIPVWSTRT
jgi:hypothetical protein